MVRLQKFLAEAGVASRRASEQMIRDGRVSVNGTPARVLGTKVDPNRDRVAVDGLPVKARRKLYVALHKPPRCVCTRRDPLERRTILDVLPAQWQHLVPVGRLDYASEGLIFLTNDGEFCLRLTHPRYGVRKVYRVEVEARVAPDVLKQLTRGVVQDGERLRAAQARILSANNTRSVLEVTLTEGRNREVRRLLEALGFTVRRLIRTQIGPIKLGELPPGHWRTLTETEIKSLLGRYENQPVAPARACRRAERGHALQPGEGGQV